MKFKNDDLVIVTSSYEELNNQKGTIVGFNKLDNFFHVKLNKYKYTRFVEYHSFEESDLRLDIISYIKDKKLTI